MFGWLAAPDYLWTSLGFYQVFTLIVRPEIAGHLICEITGFIQEFIDLFTIHILKGFGQGSIT